MTTGDWIFAGAIAWAALSAFGWAYAIGTARINKKYETRHPSGRTEGSPRRTEPTTGSKHASGGGVTPFHDDASTDKGQHDHGA